MDVLTNLVGVIFSQYRCIVNDHVTHLKITQYYQLYIDKAEANYRSSKILHD